MADTRRFLFTVTLFAGLVTAVPALAGGGGGRGGGGNPCDMGVCPDLRTVIPKQLGIQNQQGRETLRLTNGIANVSPGHMQVVPDCTKDTFGTDACPEPTDAVPVTNAIQQVLDADGNVVFEKVVSTFEYHTTHNHWHTQDIARFAIHHADDDGTGGAVGALLMNDLSEDAVSDKVGFCLEDTYRLSDGKSPTRDRVYWDCEVGLQGIQSGWVDQYHQSLDGQEVDLTGAPAGLYYLVSTANPRGTFIEADYTNNTAWVSFELLRESNGNAKIRRISHSSCDSPGMCGDYSRNGP